MAPRLDRASPAYVQVADFYRSKIHDGSFAEGARLPSLTEVGREFGISRATAVRAITQLQVEGLTYSNPRGTWVAGAEHKAVAPQTRVYRAHGPTGSTAGARESHYVTAAEVIEPPRYVSELLDLDQPGARVVRREWITSEDGTPRALSVTWYPAQFADEVPRLLSVHRDEVGEMLAALEARFGAVERGRTFAHARTADAREAGALGVPIGTAIMAVTWLLWSGARRDLVEYGESVLPPRSTLSWPFVLVDDEDDEPILTPADQRFLFHDDEDGE
jgi:GntR family transcriptional regulator